MKTIQSPKLTQRYDTEWKGKTLSLMVPLSLLIWFVFLFGLAIGAYALYTHTFIIGDLLFYIPCAFAGGSIAGYFIGKSSLYEIFKGMEEGRW